MKRYRFFSLVSLAVGAFLATPICSCSDNDGPQYLDANINPAIQFCNSAEQRVVLNGETIEPVDVSAVNVTWHSMGIYWYTANLEIEFLFLSGEHRLLVTRLWFEKPPTNVNCLPPFETKQDGIEVSLHQCDGEDCQAVDLLDVVELDIDESDIAVDGSCDFGKGTTRFSLCLKASALSPADHPLLQDVEIFVQDVPVENKTIGE